MNTCVLISRRAKRSPRHDRSPPPKAILSSLSATCPEAQTELTNWNTRPESLPLKRPQVMEIATALASSPKRLHPTHPLRGRTCNFLARSSCLLARGCRAEGSHLYHRLPFAGAICCPFAPCVNLVSDMRKKENNDCRTLAR